MKAIEHRFQRLQERWNTFVAESDEREAQQYLDAGASPDVPWQQWPAPLLALLAQLGKDPAEIHAALRAVLARRQDANTIKIVWLDRLPAPWEEQPLLIVQPGYIDMLRPDPEPRLTTMPMTPAEHKRFGDEGVELVVSYTDKKPHTAPTPAQGASMPVTAPERPQPPPQAPEPPYNFEEARRSTLALARRQDRTRRRLHVR